MRADQHGHRALRVRVQDGQGVPLRSPSEAKGGTRRFLGAGSHAMGAEARDTFTWGRVERPAIGRTEGPSREVWYRCTIPAPCSIYLSMARLRRMSAVVVLRAACRLVAGRHARLRRRATRTRCGVVRDILPFGGGQAREEVPPRRRVRRGIHAASHGERGCRESPCAIGGAALGETARRERHRATSGGSEGDPDRTTRKATRCDS